MATTITIKALNPCASGGHATIQLSGDVTYSFPAQFDIVGAEAQSLSNEQILAALVRIALLTRTAGQLKAALASAPGLTVTV